jgi:hypothetical protein
MPRRFEPKSRDRVSYLFGCQSGSGGSEVDAVEAQPAGRLEEARECLDVGGCDLRVRAAASRRPQNLVDRSATDPQNAVTEAPKERDEVAIGGSGSRNSSSLIFS